MKYYIIAGEASGDLHGARLMASVKKNDPLAEFRGFGGDKMSAEGAQIIKHYRDLAFMGFVEVVKNLNTIFKNLRLCKADIKAFSPDVIILIDYPGFNLRIAEWAHEQKYKVVYYISPQVWAWKESRVQKIRRTVDKMLVILPFENEFYRKFDYDVTYVGHPLVNVIDEFVDEKNEHGAPEKITDKGAIALLPGSRKQEIAVKLPIMLSVAKHFPDYAFVVAKAPSVDDAFYAQFLSAQKNVFSVVGKTYDLLYRAKAALVTSGTATLEVALFNVPEVVCYKGSAISYSIAKRLIKVPYISLVNLILNKEAVKELIQDELTEANLVKELNALLHDPERRRMIAADYKTLREKLRSDSDAADKAADEIEKLLNDAISPSR